MNVKKIIINNIPYTVKTFSSKQKLEKGYAYYIKKYNLVLPYFGRPITEYDILKDAEIKEEDVGLYDKECGGYTIIPPREYEKYIYDPSNIYEITNDNILELINKQEIPKEQIRYKEIDTIGNIYCPHINEDDDILLFLIKKAISEKKINIKEYINKFPSISDMNNWKRGLTSTNTMTFARFCEWCKVLDLEFEIKIKDSTNSIDPMGIKILYDSIKDEFKIIDKD